MIKTRFSKAILPLAFTTAISGGMLVKTTVDNNKNEIKTEQPAKTNPIENPAVLGTIFTLGLFSTAGAAALGRAVDLRYKTSHEKIEDIFNFATLNDSDYQEAFEEVCKELDKKGEVYDKEELKKLYTPKSKEEILNLIDMNKDHLRRVTENCNQDKRAAIELNYLIEEVKSAVKYGYEIKSDDIKYQMLYRFDKASLPEKEWTKKEKQYKADHPEIDFDKQIGVPLEKKWQHYAKAALVKTFECKEITIENPEDFIKLINEIKERIEAEPEILNQYDRKECLDRINRAEGLLEAFGKFPQGLWQEILNIYIVNQRSY